jgi:hypothetical protein
MKNKMMKNKAMYGILALAIIAVIGVGFVAANGGFGLGNGFMKQNMTDEQKAQLKAQD